MTLTDVKKTKFSNLVTMIGFCFVVFIPFTLGFIQADKKTSIAEKRKLTTLPKAPQTLSEIQNYPTGLASYYSDHFGLRDNFVKNYKRLKYSLGDSTSDNLTIGKDGWLFLGNIKDSYEKFGDPFGDVRRKNLYTETELSQFAENISSFNSWLNDQGIQYVFIIAPNKHTIYSDKLPPYIEPSNADTATDQLINHLSENTKVEIIDLREPLIKERTNHDVYFKTDTHWNHYGANIAQYNILDRISTLLPGKVTPQKYDMKFKKDRSGDLATMLGVSLDADKNPQPIFPNNCRITKEPEAFSGRDPHSWFCEGQSLKALIYRDSFFTALEPYFIRNFAKSTYIWETATYDSVVKYIRTDKPDIIIEEWVERKLPKDYPSEYKALKAVNIAANKSVPPAGQKPTIAGRGKTLYKKQDGGLKFHQIDSQASNNKTLKLKAIGRDPIIYFPNLNLINGKTYNLHIKFTSDVKSKLWLYYSTSDTNKFPFTDENSVQRPVKIGENDLNIDFSYPNIGPRLRLDVISRIGNIEISELEIYEK